MQFARRVAPLAAIYIIIFVFVEVPGQLWFSLSAGKCNSVIGTVNCRRRSHLSLTFKCMPKRNQFQFKVKQNRLLFHYLAFFPDKILIWRLILVYDDDMGAQ